MLFFPAKPLRLVSVRNLTSSKTGKPFSIVSLADSDTFENCEFFLDSSLQESAARGDFPVGKDYTVSVAFGKSGSSVTLSPIEAAKSV